MSATYQFYAIPLDVTSSTDLHFELICSLDFAPGSYTSDQLTDIVTANPLWKAIADNQLEAWIVPFRDWRNTNPRPARLEGAGQLRTAKFTFAAAANRPSVDVLRTRMRNYFGTSAVAGPPPAPDLARETRKASDLADMTNGMHSLHSNTQSLRDAASSQFKSKMLYGTGLSNLSMPFLRWIDTASRAAILEKVFKNQLPTDDSLRSLKDAADKIKRRSKGVAQKVSDGLHANGQSAPLDAADLNAAVHALMREPYLAQYLGFRTSWVSQGFALPNGTFLIQPTNAFYPTSTDGKNMSPVAFYRGAQTHPIAYADVGLPHVEPFIPNNGLFVRLNKTGSPSYSTTCIETESQLTRDVVVQATNSLAAPANHPEGGREVQENPKLLKQQRAGSTEPRTSGVQFSGPAADLVYPQELISGGSRDAARANWPCLFLEDLWIGYRLEIRRKGGKNFLSIHREQKYYTLQRGGTAPDTGAAGAVWVEGFIERDQQDAGPGKPASTNLFTYNGFSAQQMEDYKIALGRVHAI